MDLLIYFQNEIKCLNLKDKFSIARFIYLRLGELFTYDSAYYTYNEDSKERKKLYDKRINIRNVRDFKVVCASWARMYEELLQFFNIKAYYKESSKKYSHAYVIFYIGINAFLADMTIGFEDISNIKFGLHTNNFECDNFLFGVKERLKSLVFKNCESYSQKEKNIDENLGYKKGIYMNEVIAIVKQEIYDKKYKNLNELINRVLSAIMLIMNVERENVNFSDGETFISELLKYFLERHNKNISSTQLFDGDRDEFMALYVNTLNQGLDYYWYHKNFNGFYKLEKITRQEAIWLCQNYICAQQKILKLI